MNFCKYMYEKDLPWTVQIVQNILSIACMIPIRIYDMNKAIKIWKDIKTKQNKNYDKLSKYAAEPLNSLVYFMSKENYDSIKEIESFFLERKNSPWITRPSYPHPIIADLEKMKCYKAWEQIFVYHWIENDLKIKNSGIRKLFDSMLISYKRLNITNYNYVVIFGPVFKYGAKGSEELFFIDRVKPILEKVHKIQNERNWGLYNNFKRSLDNWRNISSLRPGWIRKDLQDTMRQTTSSLEQIFSLEVTEDFDFSRSMCRRLTYAAWAVNSWSFCTIIENLVYKFYDLLDNSELKIYVNFPISFYKEKECIVSCIYQNDKYILKINKSKTSANVPEIRIGKSYNEFLELTEMDKDQSFYIKSANKKLRYFSLAIERKIISLEESYAQERVSNTLNWFRREIGIIPRRLGNEVEEPLKPFCNRVANEVLILLNADICNLYLYNYGSDLVSLLGYFIDKGSRIIKNNVNDVFNTLKVIESMDINSPMRKKSMNYNVIRDKKPLILRAVHIKNKKIVFEPKEATLINSSCKYFKSGITVPLKINERVIGTLGVAGVSNNQFRYQNLHLLTRMSQVLSPYIFTSLLLSSTGYIAKKVIDPTINIKDKFDVICEQFSQLFFSYGAVLWIVDDMNENLFVAKGWTKTRSELNHLSKESKKNVSIDYDDKTSTFYDILHGFNYILDEEVSYQTVKVSDMVLKFDDWFKNKNYRSWTKNNKINEITCIPVFNQETKKVIAFLSLYYKSPNTGLNKSWISIIDYMSYFLTLLLDAMIIEQMAQRNASNIINHELKQNIDVIADRINLLSIELPYRIKNAEIKGKKYSPKVNWILNDLIQKKDQAYKIFERVSSPDFFVDIRTKSRDPLYLLSGEKILSDDKMNIKKLYNETIKPKWKQKNTKMLSEKYFGPHTGPYLFIPSLHLKAIFSNLIDNAIKYAIKGTEIISKSVISKNSYIFSISNYADKLENDKEKYFLFNEGYRGSNSKEIKNGQGTGLHVVRQFCEMNRGEAWVDILKEEKNDRYTFNISFPVDKITNT